MRSSEDLSSGSSPLTGSWPQPQPNLPFPPLPSFPLPMPSGQGQMGTSVGLSRIQQSRLEYLWRKHIDLRLELQQLDGQEQALLFSLASLPSSGMGKSRSLAWRILKIVLICMGLLAVVGLLFVFPSLMIPVPFVLFVVYRKRRPWRRWKTQHASSTWVAQEQRRLDFQRICLAAQRASVHQRLQLVQAELDRLHQQAHGNVPPFPHAW